MRKFWIVFVIMAVLIGGGLGLLWKFASSRGGSTASSRGGLLHWRAGGAYPEAPGVDFMDQLQHGESLAFRQVLFGLRRASKDPQIKALLIELEGLKVSWAQLEEMHAAVSAFAATGKPVWATVTFAGNADYALASAADRVVMAPEGNLMVMGVAAELAFLKDTLAKAGLAADFLHVGEYKSAPEQLTRREASDANRAMTTSLVDERYRLLVDLIAAGRGRDASTVGDWIDQGLHDGESALANGLVDTLQDASSLVDEFFADEKVAEFDSYARHGRRKGARHEAALIVAAGTIYPGESGSDGWQGPVVGSDTVIEQLTMAREDDDVEAVLLRVNSPGGSALASDLIWREIARVREVKPVVVSMGGYAASGGYYIACGADSIFADKGTLTGSIGVFAGKMDWSGLYDKLDLHREFITRGENALMWSDAGGFTPGQREIFQGQLDRFYARFVDKVSAGRGMASEEVDRVARGRVWTGSQAFEHGLIDGIGGLERSLASVKGLVGAEPDELLRLRTYDKELTWLERAFLDALHSRALGAAVTGLESTGPLPEPLRTVAVKLARSGLADIVPLLDGRPLALMTWRLVEQ